MELSIDEYKAMQSWWRKWMIRDELKTFCDFGLEIKSMDILEVGCGSGYAAGLLVEKGVQSYIGLDIMKAQIDAANQKNIPNAVFQRGDAADLSAFEDRSFDAIVDLCILHHVEGWRKFFDEAYRVLKDGGSIYAADLSRSFIHMADSVLHWNHAEEALFSFEEFEQQALKSGFLIAGRKNYGNMECIYRFAKADSISQNDSDKYQKLENTMYLPLAARIYVSEHFPSYFFDAEAITLRKHIPYTKMTEKTSEYYQLAGACRFHVLDQKTRAFIAEYRQCNIINAGCGLETSWFRLRPGSECRFYELDLPAVIEKRRELLGEGENEILIEGDMFDLSWADRIDCSLPSLINVIGVFQYFSEEEVADFLMKVREKFPEGQLIFDAMGSKALAFASSFVRKSGSQNAEMHFSIDDPQKFAEVHDLKLISAEPFFTEARHQLKLKPSTRMIMKLVDEGMMKGRMITVSWENE